LLFLVGKDANNRKKKQQMQFQVPLIHGKLIKRYKRFLADVALNDGSIITAHCTNSGSMLSCIEVGADVGLSPAPDPNRKTKFTWEIIKIDGQWVGINTMVPNLLVYEAIKNGQIKGLDSYPRVFREVKFDESRLDILAENDHERCAIEVKNVTMKVGTCALFPDAVTERGLKHLQTLMRLKHEGLRAVMVYVVQRTDVTSFGVAEHIDPNYASGLVKATEAGVEVFALQANVSPNGIVIANRLPYLSPAP
jgi:sugar fermentation stimulation protein A